MIYSEKQSPCNEPPTLELGIHLAPRSDMMDLRQPWKYMLIGSSVLGIMRSVELIRPELTMRNHLPEPIDVPDHIGNIAAFTSIAMLSLRQTLARNNGSVMSRKEHDRNRIFSALLVGGIAVAANLYGEMKGYGNISTPDAIDFTYGLFGGFMFYQAKKASFLPEAKIDSRLEKINNILEHEPANQRALQLKSFYSDLKSRIVSHKNKLDAKSFAKPSSRDKDDSVVKNIEGNSRTKPNNKTKKFGRYTPPKSKRQNK